MSKILIIPDVHGRDFWREPVKRIDEYQEIIFLGDYLDPYEVREHISRENAFDEFVDIMKLQAKNSDKVTLLLGNHDLHYLWSDSFSCSRKNFEKVTFYSKLFRQSIKRFSLIQVRHYGNQQYVFTHSGILNGWLENNKDIVACYLDEIEAGNFECFSNFINDLLHRDEPGILADVGKSRKGNHDYGSLIWADVREHQNVECLKNAYQIFGHSLMHEPMITDNWACLDCCHAFELDTNDGSLRMLTSEEKP